MANALVNGISLYYEEVGSGVPMVFVHEFAGDIASWRPQIDFFGRRYGLPPALSGHQTYFLWGPRGYSGKCMIVLDDTKETLEGLWDRVEFVGTSPDNPYALEKNIDVFICRGPKFGTLADIWPKVKKWR